jgi:2-haloacid dehalogenase
MASMTDEIARREVKALVFDVFGTVVDWRTSLIDELTQWAQQRKIEADWTALVDAWREAYIPSMNETRKAGKFVKLDILHRQSLDRLIERFGIKGLSEADREHINLGWHRLKPWPDSVSGLTRLKTKFIISPLSNGNVILLTNMAKNTGLPWDLIMGSELFEHFKPDPETYLGAARLLSMQPGEVMMVAAHNGDLKAAQSHGLKTAFVPRPAEYGPNQKRDFEATGQWTMVVKDFNDLAQRLGC